MRAAIVIVAAVVIAGAIWIGVSANTSAPQEAVQTSEAPVAEAEFRPRTTVCSMDPALRPRPGAQSCRARP